LQTEQPKPGIHPNRSCQRRSPHKHARKHGTQHKQTPPPFPQVDAALDATNVARVAQYIRTRTRPPADGEGDGGGERQQGAEAGAGAAQQRRQKQEQQQRGGGWGGDGGGGEGGGGGGGMAPFQSIVISLKDNFYEKARFLGGGGRRAWGGALLKTFENSGGRLGGVCKIRPTVAAGALGPTPLPPHPTQHPQHPPPPPGGRARRREPRLRPRLQPHLHL
jgi:hypothetical protein